MLTSRQEKPKQRREQVQEPEKPRWGVVTTSIEPADILVAFARHHLALGASEIFVFLDQPDPVARQRLNMIPGVSVAICDLDHWRSRGFARRPRNIERRQVENACRAYAMTGCDWLAHIDSDEFIHGNPGDLTDELALIPEGIDWLRLPPAERVYIGDAPPGHLFEGGFRAPRNLRPQSARALFGPSPTAATGGFAGHCSGKGIVRTGLPLVMGIHSPRAGKGYDGRTVAGLTSARTLLLHFDGLTPQHWLHKIAAYAQRTDGQGIPSAGLAHAEIVARAHLSGGDQAVLRRLHDEVKVVDARQAELLRAFGMMHAFQDWSPLDFERDRGPAPDLGVQAYDRRLGDLAVAGGYAVREVEDAAPAAGGKGDPAVSLDLAG